MKAKNNPFRSECIESLPFVWPADCDLENLRKRWESTARRGALIAPKGHGKSTLLKTLIAHFAASGWSVIPYQLREETPSFPPHYRQTEVPRWDRQTLLFLDGAEQLNPLQWWRWKRWSRRAGGVLITRHTPGGFPTLLKLTTDPELLERLLDQLYPSFAELLPCSLEDYHARFKGDLRLIFRDLYDRAARFSRSPAIPVPSHPDRG